MCSWAGRRRFGHAALALVTLAAAALAGGSQTGTSLMVSSCAFACENFAVKSVCFNTNGVATKGTYRWKVAGGHLTLTKIHDSCKDAVGLFAGAWARKWPARSALCLGFGR